MVTYRERKAERKGGRKRLKGMIGVLAAILVVEVGFIFFLIVSATMEGIETPDYELLNQQASGRLVWDHGEPTIVRD